MLQDTEQARTQQQRTGQVVAKRIDIVMATLTQALSDENLEDIENPDKTITQASCDLYFLGLSVFRYPGIWGKEKIQRAKLLLEQAAKAAEGSNHEEACAEYAKEFQTSRKTFNSLFTPDSP